MELFKGINEVTKANYEASYATTLFKVFVITHFLRAFLGRRNCKTVKKCKISKFHKLDKLSELEVNSKKCSESLIVVID